MPDITQGLRPYAISRDNAANTAEINMYGAVVAARPVDWRGDPIPGDFIILQEFLDDLNELATCSRITIHINSGGGDMYAGVAIYHRLLELDAEVVTIVDGLAASAASVIFVAGDIRRVYPGSNIMIHSAAVALCGYYRDYDLTQSLDRVNAHTQSMINIYADRTGKTEDEIHAMVDGKETWFTGKAAVDEGFATELAAAPSKAVQLKYSPDRAQLCCGSYAVAASLFTNIPGSVPVMTQAEYDAMRQPANDAPKQGIALLIENMLSH